MIVKLNQFILPNNIDIFSSFVDPMLSPSSATLFRRLRIKCPILWILSRSVGAVNRTVKIKYKELLSVLRLSIKVNEFRALR
jgi:hypothetical protein